MSSIESKNNVRTTWYGPLENFLGEYPNATYLFICVYHHRLKDIVEAAKFLDIDPIDYISSLSLANGRRPFAGCHDKGDVILFYLK